jgi:hypothetical protein
MSPVIPDPPRPPEKPKGLKAEDTKTWYQKLIEWIKDLFKK